MVLKKGILLKNEKPRDNQIQRAKQSHFDSRLQLQVLLKIRRFL